MPFSPSVLPAKKKANTSRIFISPNIRKHLFWLIKAPNTGKDLGKLKQFTHIDM